MGMANQKGRQGTNLHKDGTILWTYRQANRQTDWKTERKRDWKTDRHREWNTEKQTEVAQQNNYCFLLIYHRAEKARTGIRMWGQWYNPKDCRLLIGTRLYIGDVKYTCPHSRTWCSLTSYWNHKELQKPLRTQNSLPRYEIITSRY